MTVRDVSPARDALGRALRVLRARRDRISAEGVGRAAGVGRHTVGAVERGAVDPRVSTLRAVVGALGCQLSDLFLIAESVEREIVSRADAEKTDGRRGGRPSGSPSPGDRKEAGS